MFAARLDLDSGHFGVTEVPVPEPPPGWVRVRVRSAGVCMTDLHLIHGVTRGLHRQTGLLTLGHEVAGEVDLAGAGVTGWEPGERVAVSLVHDRPEGEFTLGVDFDGGWADFVVTPASTLVRLPASVSFEVGSIVPDAVSTPWAAITGTAEVRPGEAVAVWGIGGVGTHAIALLRFVGAAPIIAVDPRAAARARALKLGADHVIDPTGDDAVARIKELTRRRGVDVAFDFVGSSRVEAELLQAAAPSGRAVFVGVNMQPLTLEVPALLLIMRHRILGHYASGLQAVPELFRLLELGRLDLTDSISGRFALADAAKAVAVLEAGTDDPVRLVLTP